MARSAWPSISWTERRSAPPSSRWVANEWRSRCGWTRSGSRPGLRGEPAQDQERAGAREAAALGVQEQLRPVARVEERPAAREVAAQRLHRLAADRDDALLRALADAAHEPCVEVDARLLEADGLADAQARAVEQLDERAVAQVARRRARRCFDEPLGLGRARACAAACAGAAAGRARRPGCRRARRAASGAGRTSGSRRRGGRSSPATGRPRAARRGTARAARS